MWKTFFASLLRGFAPALIETAASAIGEHDKPLAPLPPTDGTDFGEPAQVKRKPRRSLAQLLADEERQLALLQQYDMIALSPAQMRRHLLQIENVKARVAMYRSRLEAEKEQPTVS